MRKYRMGTTQEVRAAAKQLGTFTPTDVVYFIDPEERYREKMIRNTVQELFKRGEIERIEPGRYRYVQDLAPQPTVRKRILRAIHAQGKFCQKDIRKLSDAEASYILVVIRKLKKAGYLELIGKCSDGNVFRVRHADRFYQDLVKGDGFADKVD